MQSVLGRAAVLYGLRANAVVTAGGRWSICRWGWQFSGNGGTRWAYVPFFSAFNEGLRHLGTKPHTSRTSGKAERLTRPPCAHAPRPGPLRPHRNEPWHCPAGYITTNVHQTHATLAGRPPITTLP